MKRTWFLVFALALITGAQANTYAWSARIALGARVALDAAESPGLQGWRSLHAALEQHYRMLDYKLGLAALEVLEHHPQLVTVGAQALDEQLRMYPDLRDDSGIRPVLALVAKRYPTLPGQLGAELRRPHSLQRLAHDCAAACRVYPGLPVDATRVLLPSDSSQLEPILQDWHTRHPDAGSKLLHRLSSLEHAHPELRRECLEAVERRLPGLAAYSRQWIRGHLSGLESPIHGVRR